MTKKADRILRYTQNIVEFCQNFVDSSDLQNESWYEIEHNNIAIAAKTLEIPHMVLTAMVAATSPLVKWQAKNGNKPNFECAISIVKDVLGIEHNGRYAGFHRNRENAARILQFWLDNKSIQESDFLNVKGMLSGKKVTAFYENLMYPKTSVKITIDVWMERLASRLHGGPTNTRKSDAVAIRDAYLSAYVELKLHTTDISLHMFQSALWLLVKNSAIAALWLMDFNDIERFV